MVCFIKLTLILDLFLFPTGESTAATGEETTAVLPGKTLNSRAKDKEKIISLKIFVTELLALNSYGVLSCML